MKKTVIRLAALCLALVCTFSLVTAAAKTGDMNGDNVINVWDLQMVKTSSDEDKTTVLTALLGGGDELHPKDGVYEIYSPLGLYNMARKAAAGASFILMADIDLGGRTWDPIVDFKGSFDGNNKTISNVTITGNQGVDTGFFSRMDRYTVNEAEVQSVVENLNLRNVDIVVTDAEVQYIGLLTGSNRGIIRNCTSTGSVTDTRTAFDGKVRVGTLAGRNDDHDTIPGKVITGANTMTVTAGSPNAADQVTGVTSQMAFFPAEGSAINYVKGIAGYSATPLEGMIWQDTTGSVDYIAQTLRQRRQSVVDAMYQQGTVKWTPSKDFYYTVNGSKTSTHSTAYIAGTTYTGVPYNGCSNSYGMFLSQMQAEKDEQQRYVTNTDLEDGTKRDGEGYSGFVEYMGNDCSSAISWAWGSVILARASDYGVNVNTTPTMVPNAYNTKYRGVIAAGGYQVLPTDETKYKEGIDARDTRSIIALNGGAEGMAEFYAKASRGDALLFVEYAQNAEGEWIKGGGHARMLGYDPMIIRNADGSIDLNKSYVITHEQGDGLYDNRNANGEYETYDGYNVKQTSWRTDYKYPLSVLLTEEGYNGAVRPGCGYGYVPVTVGAFHYDGQLRAPYLDAGYTSENNYHPVSLPNNGWYYCSYMVEEVRMTIQDADGVVYEKTRYQPCTNRSNAFQTIKLDELFSDATTGLENGQTYYVTLEAKTACGQWVSPKEMKNTAFTYTAPEITQ